MRPTVCQCCVTGEFTICGLAAIFNYHSAAAPVDRPELLRIREAMLRRGPDGEGLWVSDDQRIGLAHRRLAIIDLSASGAQPMATADGAARVVFNGEIYNHRELRQRLETRGYSFQSSSDTEVLLHLYQEYGRDMVQHLRGMYAFALWDNRQRGLFLARDPFGIKPLYIADNGSTVRVASQVKALLKGDAMDTTAEPAGHVGFYLWGHVPEPYTLYKGIRTLPAGTTLWIDANGKRENRKFFSITDELAQASTVRLSISREEMHERLRTALLDSVRHHMIADVPVGVFLSAGLDSTTLTALARETFGPDPGAGGMQSTNALHTITLGFKEFVGTTSDEVPLAERVAQRYGTVHHATWVTQDEFQAEYRNLLDAMDQPSTDGVNTYFVSKATKVAGLKVALSGLGGDELFGGYPSFRQLPRLVKALSPFSHLPALGKGFRYLSAPLLKHFTSPKYAGLLEYGGSYGGAYLLRRGMFMPWELPGLLDGDLVRAGWAELKTISCLEQTTRGIDNAHLKVTALESAWYLRNQLLRDADWAGMAHSLEIRTPLVDVDLFRAVTPLLNSTHPPGKRTLAVVPSSPLPDEILKRKKTGFAIPVRRWLMKDQKSASLERGLRAWALRLNKPVKPRRILVLLSDGFGGVGGIAKFNRDLLTALAGDPAVSRVIAVPRLMPGAPGKIPDKIEYVTSALGGKFNFVRAVLASLRDHGHFDLVICGHINLISVAYLAKKITRAPLLLITHGIEAWQPTNSWLANSLARKIDGFIAVSALTKQRFMSWAGLLQVRSWILPNSFDPATFSPRAKNPELLRRYALENKTVLVTCGRLSSHERFKGFDQVIELLPELEKEIPNIAYLIMGDGDDRERLRKKAQQLHVEERVVFAGFVPEAEKSEHYCLGDAYVMPSRGEGFGIVYLEAMACGLPTVGSKADGSRDALREGELGILVDPCNPEDIKRGIREALARPKRVPEGLAYFSFANFGKRLQAIIHALPVGMTAKVE